MTYLNILAAIAGFITLAIVLYLATVILRLAVMVCIRAVQRVGELLKRRMA